MQFRFYRPLVTDVSGLEVSPPNESQTSPDYFRLVAEKDDVRNTDFSDVRDLIDFHYGRGLRADAAVNRFASSLPESPDTRSSVSMESLSAR